jgi:pyruvate dehydrogenase E1 component
MDGLFRAIGIYSHAGQLYEPVDANQLAYYKEAQNGQLLEEGITEAGSMSSWIAAATAYANHGIKMVPFYVYYSMFGPQRIGDLVWAAGDLRARGFLIGGTAGRTTLNGEGLQHEDGHSHLLFSTVPTAVCYDPAYAYEIGVIIREGLRRMYVEDEDVFFYITVGNENYVQPPKPDRKDIDEGILKGMYLFRAANEVEGAKLKKDAPRVQLIGSGSLLNHVLKAQQMLIEEHGVAADVYSATSYIELRREALDVERWNLLNPDKKQEQPYVAQLLGDDDCPVVCSSDYMKILPDGIAKYLPNKRLVALGTDGFGRSERRPDLRNFFEVDERYVTLGALKALAEQGKIDKKAPAKALKAMNINPEKRNPHHS